METLPDLIGQVLAARDETVTAFAARIGVNRLTVNRWKESLPAAATLRRVADDLAVPYSRVLMSALASAGYASSPADLLAGQQVHVVTNSGGDPYDEAPDIAIAGVFTDPERAAEYVTVADAISDGAEIESRAVVIDSTAVPHTVEIFNTVWSSRTDAIRQSSSLAGSAPARLHDRDVTGVEATAFTKTGEIYFLQVDSLTPEAGREALTAAVDALRRQGRLLPPGIDPHPGVAGWMAYMVDHLQAPPSPPQSDQASSTSPSPLMQEVPATLSEAHGRVLDAARRAIGTPYSSGDSRTSGVEPEAVWEPTRRFIVDPVG